MADDKFILMGLDDENSKSIAEVLQNKTCKKLLDYLAETKEASEKDISDALNLPLNTVEYNLTKLTKSGLVEKTKNFFWSVKGKKIPMYKLARKHIIISTNKKPSLEAIKALLPVISIIAIALILVGLIGFDLINTENNPYHNDNASVSELNNNLKSFNNLDELESFIQANRPQDYGYYGNYAESDGISFFSPNIAKSAADSSVGASASNEQSASSYSTTNIQVEGVDEADIVKNDGKYVYALSGGKLYIIEAYPAENMKVVSQIDDLSGVGQIYLNEDKLVLFASDNRQEISSLVECFRYPCYEHKSFTLVYVYNIEDKENPKLENKLEIEGSYADSRMIGDYVYIVSSKYVNYDHPRPPVYILDGVEKQTLASEIYYWDYYDDNYQFTTITALDIDDGEYSNKVYLMGSSHTLYVSQDNIYLTQHKNYEYRDYVEEIIDQVYKPVLDDYQDDIEKIQNSSEPAYAKLSQLKELVEKKRKSLDNDELDDWSSEFYDKMQAFELYAAKQRDRTLVHKISINKDEISYVAEGDFPGSVLNQFSMDEYEGNFRVATTSGNFWSGESVNNLYILNEDLKIIGSVQDLAKGEKIYSARFMGKRAYMVTFKKVDPLFVIDVQNPQEPQVLGYLKITGYSDYLHPYDENHVIGIGKEAIAASDEEIESRNLQFAWYQGVKVSLFDVSDVNNPKEVGKIVIGDRGTDSDALSDHKAVLFDKEKGILVLPISLYEIDASKYRECSQDELAQDYRSYSYCLTDNTYGEFVWQGAYVLNINPEDGISVRGKISHDNIASGSYYRYSNYNTKIQRSLYMDSVLYTISSTKIKANNLNDISEIKSVVINLEQEKQIIEY